ncbi:IS110 family transposase [Nocardia sp. NBC_01503]|uniref:IS110 family transposase n=1 Tax=Nocardia sp. NBC_01503 TaxID=2975997 RepID=UPI002E7BD1EA|nr:IS110 family transposase [Nocardia sp. NBC_01503]WTL29148.1 IS110 family transposase [Nocardia sp. NBC_01503]WTL29870.1 IS110 family transposase [Nocardia sp. NBC_01503]WTL30289.1 IS110 family transposase [Nocardia sp. NBC_01503]
MAASRPVTNISLVAGADTHADTIHVAALDAVGRELGDHEFPTTATGYRDALEFLASHGTVDVVGIEGTSSYGAGFTRAVLAAGIEVREVIRPERSVRRMHGKSDPIDAYQAARAVLSGRANAAPKTEQIEALRALNNARRSAVKASTAAMNQIHHMLITAPAAIREKYRHLKDKALVTALAACRPDRADPVVRAVLTALKTLAQRHRFLTTQADDLQKQVRELATAANPHLMSLHGVGPNTAAQLLITAGANPERLRSEASFAALCGTAPVPASSGKTTRYRLSRGGDRHANCALHTIALVRMSSDARTREFVRAQRDKGRNPAEILRILKRAIAREVFKSLTRGLAAPGLEDLRPARQAKNIPLSIAAAAMGTYVTKICRTELGTYPDYELAQRYRAWLAAA